MYFIRQLLRASILVAAVCVACFPPFTVAQSQNSSRVLRICTYFTTNSSSNTFTSEFQANTGFKFWTDYVNNELGGLEINRVKYRIEQINIDHPGGNPELVADNVRKAVESQNFDFVVGGHTQYTKAVSDALNSSRPIPQIQCCTGPRSIYSAGYPNLFGLHLPSDYYTYPFLTYLKTVGVSKILLLISDQAEFTKSTGAHALKFATDATNGMKFEVLTKNYTWGATKKTELSQLASMIREGVDFGAEALISVSLTEDGKMVTRALQQVKYDFKYVYITVAPTEPNFITNETALGAQYVFSSSQWHHTMNFKDETRSFYSSKQYAEKFRSWLESQSLLGQMPTYTHASGTGAGVLLQLAMKSANSIDPKQVMAALRDFNAETFFGRIQMDRDQRNMGRDSVVVQIVNNEERSVLPTGFAGSQPEKASTWEAREGCLEKTTILSPDGKSCSRSFNFTTSSPIFIMLTLLSATLSIASVGIGIVIYIKRNHPVIKAASPLFCYIMLVGFIVTYMSAVVFNISPTSFLCSSRIFFASIGFGLIYSGILAKTFRLYRIFDNTRLQKRRISNSYLLFFVTVICTLEMLVGGIWLAVSAPQPVVVPLNGDQLLIECVSTNHNTSFSLVIFLSNGLLVVIGSFLAFKTRTIDSLFNESRSIALSIYNILFCFIIGLPVLYSPGGSSAAVHFTFQNFLIFVPATVTMGLMFGPKLRRVFSNNSTYSVNRHNSNSTSGLKRIGGQGSVGSANSSNSSWRKGSNIGSFFQPGRKLGLLNSTGTERNPAFIGRVHQEVLVVKKAEMASWFLMRMDRWEVSLVSVCPDTKILFLINRAGETSCFSYVDCAVHSITEYSADRVFVLDITVHDPKTVNLSFQLKTEKEAVYWSRLFDISTTLDLNSSYSGSLPRTLNKSDKALPPVPINIVRDYQRPPGLMGRLGLALNIDGDTLTDDSTSD